MSSGQTAGEQPSRASYLVLGATLEPKIKSKICEGGMWILVRCLCQQTQQMGNYGQPTISMTPVYTSPPGSSYEWLHLFLSCEHLLAVNMFVALSIILPQHNVAPVVLTITTPAQTATLASS